MRLDGSPQCYLAKFENDEVRVLGYRLKPGESEPMHSHLRGVFKYLSDAILVVTVPGGSCFEGSVTRGQVIIISVGLSRELHLTEHCRLTCSDCEYLHLTVDTSIIGCCHLSNSFE